MTSAGRIVRIVAVEDTRDYEEQGDRWVPIPGSGIERACDRCGRTHEVHAQVELEDGTGAVVGTGCMGADDMAGALRQCATSAKTVRRLEVELAKSEALAVRSAAIKAEVEAMTPPAVTDDVSRSGQPVLRCGESCQYIGLLSGCTRTDLEAKVQNNWRHDQMRARGYSDFHLSNALDLRRRVTKARARLATKIDETREEAS